MVGQCTRDSQNRGDRHIYRLKLTPDFRVPVINWAGFRPSNNQPNEVKTMKKILFATTALAAVSVASGSIAQESAMMSAAGNDLSIGGYYEFGWASVSDDYKGANAGDARTYGDSELYIDFENTADNGLTYGVQIDLEIVNGSRHAESGPPKNAEESSIYISGDFGEIHLGHDDSAYGRFVLWTPTHEGTFSQDDSIHGAKFLGATPTDDREATALAHSSAGGGNYYEDNAKIVYVSPSFNGFKFGASTLDSDTLADNPTAFGASYSGDIGPGSLTVKAATQTNNSDGSTKQSDTHYGVGYDMGAFSVTISRYKGKGTGPQDNAMTQNADLERDATEFGVGFTVSDQLSIAAALTNAETGFGGTTPKQEGSFRSVSGSYAIAPGLKTTLAMNQFDVEDKNTATSKNDGSEIVWQVEMAF